MGNKLLHGRGVRPLRYVFMGGVSTLAVATFAAPAFADDAPIATAATAAAAPAAAGSQDQAAASSSSGANTVKEVVVTGLRGSLQKSLNVKRAAVGVVDAISAEDIGKFPDSNMAQAMERIPGISVSYGATALGGTPTSTGNATSITVRGFGPSFNETLYDGREISTALNNRAFDFSAVGSDFVQQIDILKTPDATLSSGAIGSTINIKFAKPLDRPGLHLSGSYSESYSPEDGHATPNGSVLFSDTFLGDTLGVLVDYAYTDQKTRANHVNVQGWEGTTGITGKPAWFIQDYGIYREYDNEQRTDGRVALQWRPASNFLVTLNDNYSRDNLQQAQNGASWWFNSGSLQNVQTNSHGTITSFDQPNSPTDFQSQLNASVIETNEAGLNMKWNVNDHFDAIFDVDHAESWLNPGGQLSSIDMDVGYGPSGPGGTNGVDIGIGGIGANSLPRPTAYGPGGNTAQFLNPNLFGSHVMPMGSNRNYDAVNQAKLEGVWHDETFRLRFGAQYVSDKEHLKNLDDFGNNDWQAYAGYGPASNNAGGVALPANFFNGSFSTSNFINGFSGSSNLPPQILAYSYAQVRNYLQGLGNPQTTNIPGAGKNCCTPPFNGVYQIALEPGSVQVVNEETASIYADFAYKTELAGMPLSLDFGAREEHTRSKSVGLTRLPNAPLQVQASDHTAYLVTYSGVTSVAEGNAYNYLLPNLDVNLSVRPDLKLRFDVSRTLTRPPLNYLTPDININSSRVNALTASSGNPGLLPFLSDNLDLGAEWYYQKNSYVSADFFVKDITNFIQGGSYTRQFAGTTLPDGSPAVFTVSDHVNAASYQVRGVELALQHVFGETGFGFQANTTIVDSNRPYNPNDISGLNLAITGLADSANLVGFYDKHGFQARIAMNWRDNVLDRWGQTQNGSQFGTEPTFVASATHVDFSTSYDISKNLQVYFEALNLTDAVYSTYGRYQEQVLDAIDTGRRFNLGFHLKM